MKIGVFGGSFDPPHLSHVAVCSFALSLTDIESILVVPCFEHAFSKTLTAFEHRLRMCTLAFEDLRRTEVSAVERELGGTSYTLRTLEHLAKVDATAELSLIVGADAVRDQASWYRFDRITELARIIVVGREGVGSSDEAALPSPPEMSATAIRGMIGRGASVEGLVPRRVLQYIRGNDLYRKVG